MFTIVVIVGIILTIYLVYRIIRSLQIDSFEDKYVFITGCDSGFGRGLAIRLDTLGFNVFAGCLTEEGASFLSKTSSKRLTVIIMDVTQTESIEKAREVVEQKLPERKGVWALVNNAGILGNLSTIELCSKEDFLKVMDVNVFGSFQVTQKFLPLLRKSRGRVVNITSMCGRFPLYGAPYCASKFALEALSDMLRRDVYDQGIHVAILEPGGYGTSMVNVGVVKRELRASLEKVDKETQSVYEGTLAMWDSTMRKVALIAPDINPVIDAYTHAITSRYPQTRYVVGADAKYFFIPLSFLPTEISDAILRVGFKLVLGLIQ